MIERHCLILHHPELLQTYWWKGGDEAHGRKAWKVPISYELLVEPLVILEYSFQLSHKSRLSLCFHLKPQPPAHVHPQASQRFYPFIFKYTDFYAAQYVSFLTQKREQMLDEFDSTNMLKFSWTIGLIGTHGYQEVSRYKGRENDVSTKL